MPLSSEEILELKALLGPGSKVSDEFRTQAQQRLDASDDERLQGWAAAGGTKADAAPVVPGELGVKGIIGQEGKGDAAALDAEAMRVAGMLDPRFSLVPQALALQPATSDPESDQAAQQKWQGGDKDAVVVYEPPVDVVRKHLLENPALQRALRPDEPPQLEEITAMDAGSSLYTEASDFMWRKTKEAADKAGRKVLRQSRLPWLSEDPEMPQTLGVRVGNAATEATRRAKAYVMGVDDTAALGLARAAQEAIQPEGMLDRPTMGVNESVPQKTSDLNAWEAQQNPLSYGAGQLHGMAGPGSNWGIADRIFKSVQEGGGMLVNALAKTRAGAAVADLAPSWLKTAGGVLGSAAAGGAAAAATQAGQEGVDALGRGEMPDLSEVGESVRDVGLVGLVGTGEAFAGDLLARGAKGGADMIRRSKRFTSERGPGVVGRTEGNMEYRFGREPRLQGETREIVEEAQRRGRQPGDSIAKEIAPPISAAAQGNTRAARVEADIESRAYQATPEGATPQPVTHLERMSLEKLRDYHQPRPDGTQRAVGKGFREAQQVFNRHIEDVSLDPVKGAVELDASEASAFLGSRQRYQLVKGDIDRATAEQLKKPIDRQAYLSRHPSKARDGLNEEIESDIDEAIGFDKDGVPRTVDKRSAEYKTAEQQVLRERFGAEVTLEPFGGSLAEYLKQRGKDRVYVKPTAYDARRTDTLVRDLKDPDLIEAAKYDRSQFRKSGEAGSPDGRGGYELMKRRHQSRIDEAEGIEKSVAGPEGDAFGPIAGLYQSHPGESQLLDKVEKLAEQSGTSGQLGRLRNLQETLSVQNRASFRGGQGQTSLRPTNWMDVAQLRFGFPALKALEGPLGPLGGGNAGRAALLGNPEDARAQARAESGARGRYEAERDRRLKEIADAKAREDQERTRRQNEPIQRRR